MACFTSDFFVYTWILKVCVFFSSAAYFCITKEYSGIIFEIIF